MYNIEKENFDEKAKNNGEVLFPTLQCPGVSNFLHVPA